MSAAKLLHNKRHHKLCKSLRSLTADASMRIAGERLAGRTKSSKRSKRLDSTEVRQRNSFEKAEGISEDSKAERSRIQTESLARLDDPALTGIPTHIVKLILDHK